MKAKLQLFAVTFLAFMNVLFVMPQPAYAQCESPTDRSILAFPTWDQYLERNNAEGCRIQNFRFPQDLVLVILALVDILIRLGAFVAVGIIIYAGFKFMLAQGQPDKLAQARSILLEAIIGLVISIIAVAIISFVAGIF